MMHNKKYLLSEVTGRTAADSAVMAYKDNNEKGIKYF